MDWKTVRVTPVIRLAQPGQRVQHGEFLCVSGVFASGVCACRKAKAKETRFVEDCRSLLIRIPQLWRRNSWLVAKYFFASRFTTCMIRFLHDG